MAPLPIPTANVRYRIQNVDSSTCLERRSQGEVKMLRWRNNNLGQQWLFEDSNGLFKIRNAEDQSYMLNASSSLGPIGAPVFTITAAQQLTPGTTQEWDLKVSPRGTFYLLNNINILLHLDNADDADPKLTQDVNILSNTTGTDLIQTKPGRENRWSIIEDSPSTLPDVRGTYVIQTLKGDAIQSTTPWLQVGVPQLSFKVSHLGEEHKWEIEDHGNGKATIENILVSKFIDVQQVGSPAVWTPVLLTTTPPQPPKWDIQKVGDFLVSITIQPVVPPPTRPTRLALTVLNDAIVLRPNMNVPNQLWSIVPVGLASFNPLITVNVDPTLSLPVGEYALVNKTSGFTAYAWIDSNAAVQASTSDPGYYFKFDLAGGNDGTRLGDAHISGILQSKPYFLAGTPDRADRSVYMDIIERKDIWRVRWHSLPNNYIITHAATLRPLVCYYPNGSHTAQPQIKLGLPNDGLITVPWWQLIPK